MLIEVLPHPRGVQVRIGSAVNRNMIAERIRSHIPRDFIFYLNGHYIIPTEFAFLLRREFTEDDVLWHSDVLHLIEEQERVHHRMEQARYEVEEALAHPYDALRNYGLLNILDPHQVEAVAAMSVPSLVGLSLFDEQGLGKTVMAICAYDRLHEAGIIDLLFVVAPKSVLVGWADDITKITGNKYRVRVIRGSAEYRRKIVRSNWDVLLVSYDSLTSDVDMFRRMLRNAEKRVMLIVDESYYVKNPDAQRSQAVSEIRQYCERAIILCGTPAPNSPRDLVHQLDIADGGVSRLGKPLPEDEEQVREYVADLLDETIYLRRLKQQALPGLPGKQVERVLLELQPRQRQLYDYARDDLVKAVRSVDDANFARQITSFLALRANLLQICSHPGVVDPLYDELPAKLLALDHLLTEIVERDGEKVVIWSYYRYSGQAIAKRYARYGLVRIDGSVPDFSARREAIQRFQTDPRIRVFLGNAAAAGAGITLTAAHHAIYESLSDQAAHYMQSLDRIHRRGQEHEVTIHILVARETLEESQYERLVEKERSSRELLGDAVDVPLTKDRFLAELGQNMLTSTDERS